MITSSINNQKIQLRFKHFSKLKTDNFVFKYSSGILMLDISSFNEEEKEKIKTNLLLDDKELINDIIYIQYNFNKIGEGTLMVSHKMNENYIILLKSISTNIFTNNNGRYSLSVNFNFINKDLNKIDHYSFNYGNYVERNSFNKKSILLEIMNFIVNTL